MGCMAGNIRWNGREGVVCLSNSRCTAVGSRFHQVLHENVLAGISEVGLCTKHGSQYLTTRTPMKCCVVDCITMRELGFLKDHSEGILPLFRWAAGPVVKRLEIQQLLQRAAAGVGLPPDRFLTHSLRITTWARIAAKMCWVLHARCTRELELITCYKCNFWEKVPAAL